MTLDPLVLARIQFACNITFHILFPVINIAMAWILLFFKTKYNLTKQQFWMDAYLFWTKIFALGFAIGIVTGVVMSFQFGANWPGFMGTVGDVAGPLLAYEVLTAFFLEATFLGVMLFGFSRVSNKVHTIATIAVAIGTTLSAFWILVLNSWMQTPAGYSMINGRAHVDDWFAVIFNPSFPYRFSHMLLASGVTAAFLLAGVSAYRWLRNDRKQDVFASLKVGVYLAAILVPLQIFVGDLHGLNTLKYQPQKIAAIEALWNTEKGASLVIFAIPNEKTKKNDYAIEVPKIASLLLTHKLNGEVKGITDFGDNHPPVAAVFWSFRIMVGVAILMLLTAWTGVLLIRRTAPPKLFLKIMQYMTFSGWIATLAGWYVTEIGRQPWIVQGVLSVKDGSAPVARHLLISSLSMYLSIYLILLVSFVSTVFYMARKQKDDKFDLEYQASGKAMVNILTHK
ncbi:MAG: cytochrome D ubiquinol oxidase subunit I [Legionellales bacterium RIFCSPHIGHO2_12_FULL_35_11]|nr:MAG: cytochrome D ubiquinol oxidase subunit I [Legionellales bacterium RIFCSPHIGHO2_12_FULL_35_11]